MREVAAFLEREFGLAFTPARQPHAQAAMRRAIDRARCGSVERYLDRIEHEPALLRDLLDEVVVGETYFFREPEQLRAVAAFVAGKAANGARVRVWCAGCASGEEAYSLAILFEGLGVLDRVSIVAVDVSARALGKAKEGIYGPWSFRGTAPWSYPGCFTPSRGKWSVAQHLRAGIEFVELNLAACRPMPPNVLFDAIVCRNVMLYFEPATIDRIARVFAASLRPGGFLVTSAADPLLTDVPSLEPLVTPNGLVYKKRIAPAPARMASKPRPAPGPLDDTPLPTFPIVLEAPPRVEAEAAPMRKDPPPDPGTYVREALALLESDRPAEAAVSARKALFLDRSIAVAHFALARALRLLGHYDAARRSLTQAGSLVAALPPDEPLAFADEVSAETLARSTGAEYALLERTARPRE